MLMPRCCTKADRIIINKTDLVTPQELLELKGAIRSVNAAALTVDTVKAAIDLDFVLDLGAFDVSEGKLAAELEAIATAAAAASRGAAEDGDACYDEECEDGSSGHGHGHGHGHSGLPAEGGGTPRTFPSQHAGNHDLSVKTVTFEELGDLDGDRLDAWLASVLWEHVIPGEGSGGKSTSNGSGGGGSETAAAVDKKDRMEILRMKGVVSIAGEDRRAVVQGVHELYDKDYTTAWTPDEQRLNRLIFIGRNLDGPALHRSFKTLLA